MARKTKKKAKRKPLDLRSKMYLVVALCSLMLLVSVAVSFVLVGGLDLFATPETPGASSEPMVAESGYDKDRNTIDNTQYETTILRETEDAGQTYVDETLFLGDSNTARMYRMFDYCSYDNAIGSVGMSGSALETYACVKLQGYSGYKTMPEAVALMQPRRVIVTFGTNDLNPNRTAAKFVEGYQAGLEAIAKSYPSVDIIVNAIPPLGQRHSNQSLTQNQVDEYNKALVQMCETQGWKFLNSAEVLKDAATGYAKEGYVEASDGIHLTRAAMEALFTYVRTHSYITEDDRPTVSNVAKHTGEKDVSVATATVVTSAPASSAAPAETTPPASEETVTETTPEPTPAPTPTPESAPEPAPESTTNPATPAPEVTPEPPTDPTPAPTTDPTPTPTQEVTSTSPPESTPAAPSTEPPQESQPPSDGQQETTPPSSESTTESTT